MHARVHTCIPIRMHAYVRIRIRALMRTVGNREIGTGISEASKRVPIFPFDTQGGKQASSYFRQIVRSDSNVSIRLVRRARNVRLGTTRQ